MSTRRNTNVKRHVMTSIDKAKWFSFEMSNFVLGKCYTYACAYAYMDAYVAHFPTSFCFPLCLDSCAHACIYCSENQALN